MSTAPLTLHELDASMLPYLGDEGALAISRRNTVLRTLNLSHASGSLTDAAVASSSPTAASSSVSSSRAASRSASSRSRRSRESSR